MSDKVSEIHNMICCKGRRLTMLKLLEMVLNHKNMAHYLLNKNTNKE